MAILIAACDQTLTYGANNDETETTETYSETVLTSRSTIDSTATVKCKVFNKFAILKMQTFW